MIDADRFWSKVDKNGPVPERRPDLGPCWVWNAGTTNGYGMFWVQGRNQKASRVAFFLQHGRWPEPCALHHCDNPICCNPAHIFEGSQADNMHDKSAKGRQARGEKHVQSKLTAADVGSIRGMRGVLTQRELGRIYGVHPAHISLIQTGKARKSDSEATADSGSQLIANIRGGCN